MTSVWFIVPAHRRFDLTRVCLRQLRRTCNAMRAYHIDATAVVIADDENLYVAADLGFATVRRDNHQLGRRFNDGHQLACDPAYNPNPADFVVPCGSDDWVDPVIFRRLPAPGVIGVFTWQSTVSEDRTRLQRQRVGYKCGSGIRIIPRDLIAAAGYRPCREHARSGVDTTAVEGIKTAVGEFPATVCLDVHPLQIVDFKSRREQIHSYSSLRGFGRGPESTDPFGDLAGFYPEAVEELRAITPALAVAA